MNGVIFVIFAWCVVQVSSSAEKHKTNEGIGFPAVNFKEGVSGLQILSRNRRDGLKKKKSYLFFDNRSDRQVELWWTDKLTGQNDRYTALWPGATYEMFSYTTHHWTAIEKYTKKRLLINNETVFSPQSNEPKNRTILIIRRPDQTDTKIREKIIETMVVVDRSVIAFHGSKENVTRYVLTLLRMSTKILQHQSLTKLGVKLTQVLSKLVLLNEKNEPNIASKDGKTTFISTCEFMNEHESRGSDIFDQKIFLTKNAFSNAGFSYHYGMCKSNSNCALIYNNGFTSAIYIAHETGHLLGMDDQNLPRGNPFVMSSRIYGRFNNHDWCRYSQIALLKNIRDMSCLNNKPSMYDKDFPFVHKYPGVHFSILKQCQLTYKKNYTPWPYSVDQCKVLECKKPTKWPYTPSFQYDGSRPLDGSECGTNKWCLSGVCQTRTEPIGLSAAIDGNWGEWKAWKSCSRTCGSGIRTRERGCNNPLPRYGGNDCVGIATEARVCNTGKKCPGKPLKEEVLCSEMGAKTDRKRQWGIYDMAKDTRDQCSVGCTTTDNDKSQRILLDVPIHDGTRCYDHYDKTSAGVCYRGKCTKVGCDDVISSGKKYDRCKVCGGDGSSCKSNATTKDDSQGKSVLDCDFNNDLCQWNIVKNHVNDLGWSRKEEKSYNQGHYLYMETSSQLEKKFKARIVSREVSASVACLSFDYRMNGDKIGRLRVLLGKSANVLEKKWLKKGSQGDMWRKADINIERNSPYKVVIEAVVKNRQHGDVAIDNIQFHRQKCSSAKG